MKAQNQREWLILLRQRLGGISSLELGRLVHASRMTSHRWHNPPNSAKPTLKQAVMLAELAQCTVEEVAKVFGCNPARLEGEVAREDMKRLARNKKARKARHRRQAATA